MPDSNFELAARIAAVVERVGGQGRAASIAGVSRATIQKWRTDNARPPLIEMQRLAKEAGVSLEWVVTGVEERVDLPNADVVRLPRFDITFSGELTQIAGADWPLVPFWREALERQNADLRQTIALIADGREMEPTIREGAMLAVDRSRADMSRSGIYALVFKSRLLLMRSEMRLDGSLVLTADGKPGEKQHVGADAIADLRPIGMVVAVLSMA